MIQGKASQVFINGDTVLKVFDKMQSKDIEVVVNNHIREKKNV